MHQTAPRTKDIPFSGYALGIEDIKRIYRVLLDRVRMAADIEVYDATSDENLSETDVDNISDFLRNDCYRILITVEGNNGVRYHGSDESLFDSDDIPTDIKTIFMSSINPYRVHRNNINPRNGFDLFLDFSKPPLFDWRNSVSAPTKNETNLHIVSDREDWSAATQQRLFDTIKEQKVRRSFLHRPLVYDIGLWIIAVPLIFWVLRDHYEHIRVLTEGLHPVIAAGMFIYAFLFGVNMYRLFFGYTKWGFPPMEKVVSRDKSRHHRKFWYAVITSVIAGFLLQLLN